MAILNKQSANKKKLNDTEAQLLKKLPAVLQKMYPAGTKSSSDFRIGDVYGSQGNSLSIRLLEPKIGAWTDHATGENGYILKLIALRFGLANDTDELLVKIKELLSDADEKHPSIIVASKQQSQLKLIAEWDYFTGDGQYIGSVQRYEDSNAKKTIRPFNKITGQYKAHPEPRPLYNQPGISKSDTVVICEGEKCAQTLIDSGVCATTAMMGATAPTDKTDWSPLINKKVLIWPDNDDVGKKYAINCAEAALLAGATSCEILSIPEGKSAGWDAADALEDPSFDLHAFLTADGCVQITQASNTTLIETFKKADWRTEHGIATVLSELYGADWKYSAAWGQWYRWNGRRWECDQVLALNYLVRQVCHAASTFAVDSGQGVRARLASAATIANVERLTRADPIHATPAENWDADSMLLNTTGGIIDLKTGTLMPHDRSKLLTKSASATPQGNCPQWLEFLSIITDGNQELIDYLQRVIGYCLTGSTTEHALFFLYGTGANGKSVFLDVISHILGDYAKNAPMDTFMDTRSDRHPTDLAGLRGARFVCANETEQGRRWNESKIKSITGGDTISARFMRQDFFEFKPQFKLIIAGNHKPSISNVDEAMSRRLHLIPFTVFIPPEKRDKHLTAKLIKERDGILAWAVEGLIKWQKIGGLKPPEIVTKATKEYLEAEDSLGGWLEDCCEVDGTAFSSTNNLYESWKRWADELGEYAGTVRKLSERLIGRKFECCRQNQKRGFKGIRIKSPATLWNACPATSSTVSELADQL